MSKGKGKGKGKVTYEINIMITSQEDDDVGDDWCFSVEVPNVAKLTPYEIVTIAKNGAKDALNAREGVLASMDTH